eukprot:Skav207916  [mRNA]  locus=scaffold190:391783:394860:- [translate_table: standard]
MGDIERGLRDKDILRAARDGDVAAVRGFVLRDPAAVRAAGLAGPVAQSVAASLGRPAVEMSRWEAVRRRCTWRRIMVTLQLSSAAAAGAARRRGAEEQGRTPLAEIRNRSGLVFGAASRGDTPLHRAAAYFGTAAVVQLLLAANAPLDATNNQGLGPQVGRWAGRILCPGPLEPRLTSESRSTS